MHDDLAVILGATQKRTHESRVNLICFGMRAERRTVPRVTKEILVVAERKFLRNHKIQISSEELGPQLLGGFGKAGPAQKPANWNVIELQCIQSASMTVCLCQA